MFGEGNGLIFLDDLLCIGNETRLLDCPHNGLGANNCFHDEDVGVRCTELPPTTNPPTTNTTGTPGGCLVPSIYSTLSINT